MSTSSKSGPYCPEPVKICNCGRRCKVVTCMTLQNLMCRFVHCRNYGGGGGCDHFEWIDEPLDERVRSMVVGLMVSNDTMTVEIKRLGNDLEAQKHEVKKLKEKNRRMKLKLCAWQRRLKIICREQHTSMIEFLIAHHHHKKIVQNRGQIEIYQGPTDYPLPGHHVSTSGVTATTFDIFCQLSSSSCSTYMLTEGSFINFIIFYGNKGLLKNHIWFPAVQFPNSMLPITHVNYFNL
ncbi:hypothetical protein Cgig2_016709 [Carnegiea gigantea]|uniref:Zinc finger GRF-type domain-containing protein n=1 Tax=Carnegiea gigantea TaxID=171969 RepID=A0A9Q1QR10_9CARY|nr:hypothetical protein Cgig2_016709 [Carnegiea gigantea]